MVDNASGLGVSPAPSDTNIAVQNHSMNEEEYMDATCSPVVQSCPLTQREQRALNPRCKYDTMHVYRIKRDGTQKLLFTFQAQSRNPGNQVFYSVSASDAFINLGRASHQTQLKCLLNGVSGPCSSHNNLRNWQFNRNIVPQELIKTKTTSELTIFTRTNDNNSRGSELQIFLDLFWVPNYSSQHYYIHSNFCGGADRSCTLHVYPDISWEIKLKGTFEDSEENADTANVQGLQFSVISVYGSRTNELTAQYQRIVANVNKLVQILKKIVHFLKSESKPKPTARNRYNAIVMSESDRNLYSGEAGATDGQVAQGLAASKLHEGFEIEWPEPDLTLKWGWKESEEMEYGKKAEFKWDITGSIKFFKLIGTIELLGPALNAIPGAGPLISRLQKAGAETEFLTVSVKAEFSAELKGQITWKQTYGKPETRELNLGGELKLEIKVQAILSTKFTSKGYFGFQAEFGAGLEGTTTSGITISLEQNLFVADGSELKGTFKINFDGITLQGLAYIECAFSYSVNEDGRATRRTSNEVEMEREVSNIENTTNNESQDQSDDVGTQQGGAGFKKTSTFTHVLLEEKELYKFQMKFN